MTGKLRQFVVYGKVTIVAAILLLVAIVVVKNWQFKTRFWPWANERDVPTLWLMLATAVFSILVFSAITRLRRVFKELSEVRNEQARQKEGKAFAERQRRLDEQERRIDEKIQDALHTKPAGEKGNTSQP